MADDGRLGFAIDIDITRYQIEIDRAKAQIDEFTDEVIRRGKEIDATISDIGRDYDISTVENTLSALKKIIADDNEGLEVLNGEIAALEQKIEQLSSQVGKSSEFTKSVGELNSKLKQRVEILGDISEKQDIINKLEGNSAQVIEDTSGVIMAQSTAVTQLGNVFKNTTSPLQAFRATMVAIRAATKLAGESGEKAGKQISTSVQEAPDIWRKLLVSIKSLPLMFKTLITTVKAFGQALLTNPIGLFVASLALLVKGIKAVAKSFDSLSERNIKLNEKTQNHLDLLQKEAEARNKGYDKEIANRERELSLLSLMNKSLEDRLKLEKEIYDLRLEKNEKNQKDYQYEIDHLDELKDKLGKLRKARLSVETLYGGGLYSREEEKQLSSQGIDVINRGFGLGYKVLIDGLKVSAGSGKNIMQDIDGQIKNLETSIVRAEEVINETSDIVRNKQQEELQRERDIANLKTSLARETKDIELSLIGDGYSRDLAMAKENNKRKLEDFKKRLAEETLLTQEEKDELYRKEEELLNKQLKRLQAQIARDYANRYVTIQRQIADAEKTSAPRTASQRREELKTEYDRKREDIDNKIRDGLASGSITSKEIALLRELQKQYNNQYEKEAVILEQKLTLERLNRERELIEDRLKLVKEGGKEEIELQREIIEQQRLIELESNRQAAEDKKKDEKLINAKYDKQQKDLAYEVVQKRIKYEQETIDLRLSYVRKGSEEEKKLRLDAIEKERKAALLANKKLDKDRQQREEDINASFDAQKRDIEKEYSQVYQRFLRTMQNMTVAQMRKTLGLLKQRLFKEMSNVGGADMEIVNQLLQQISTLEQEIDTANLSPDEEAKEEWERIAQNMQKAGNAASELGDHIGGTAGKVVSDIGGMMSALSSGIQSASLLATGAVEGLEKASVILTLISSALALGEKMKEMLESLGVNTNDPMYQRYLDFLREQNKDAKELERQYNNLSEAINNAFGSEKVRLFADQINVAQKQLQALRDEYNRLLEKQNNWWHRNGILSMSEDELDRMEELGYEIEDKLKEIEDLKQAAIDAIYGSDIQSAIERFSEAYTSMWTDGTSAAKSASELVKTMMKEMVTESIKNLVQMSGVTDKLRGLMALTMFAATGDERYLLPFLQTRGGLIPNVNIGDEGQAFLRMTPDERKRYLQSIVENAYADIDSQMSWAKDLFNDATRTGANRGIAQASQDSVDELNGRATSIQGHTFNISENSNIIRDSIMAINGNVNQIREYASNLVQMRQDLTNIRGTLNEVQSQGLAMR